MSYKSCGSGKNCDYIFSNLNPHHVIFHFFTKKWDLRGRYSSSCAPRFRVQRYGIGEAYRFWFGQVGNPRRFVWVSSIVLGFLNPTSQLRRTDQGAASLMVTAKLSWRRHLVRKRVLPWCKGKGSEMGNTLGRWIKKIQNYTTGLVCGYEVRVWRGWRFCLGSVQGK